MRVKFRFGSVNQLKKIFGKYVRGEKPIDIIFGKLSKSYLQDN